MLITTPVWGEMASKSDDHPRFHTTAAGKGRIAAKHRAARTILTSLRTIRWCW